LNLIGAVGVGVELSASKEELVVVLCSLDWTLEKDTSHEVSHGDLVIAGVFGLGCAAPGLDLVKTERGVLKEQPHFWQQTPANFSRRLCASNLFGNHIYEGNLVTSCESHAEVVISINKARL
jgi:hypothetical protein